MPEKFEKNPTLTESDDKGIQQITGIEDSFQFRVGQLEAKIDAIKERVDGNLELRKWILIAILTILGLSIAGGTFVFNIFRDSQNSYRDLQNNYYKELIELHKDFQSIIEAKINNCQISPVIQKP